MCVCVCVHVITHYKYIKGGIKKMYPPVYHKEQKNKKSKNSLFLSVF